MTEQWIFRLEEVGSKHNDIVGKKCANLGEMMKAGFHVPPGYALSVNAYSRFLDESGAKEEIVKYFNTFKADPDDPADSVKYEEASKVVRGIVESKKMPTVMEKTVKKYYADLCKKTQTDMISVATRSAGPTSHPGQYETYLHVRGADEVVRNIIRVWGSTFNTRSIIARARHNLPLEYDPIGVAVLSMVDAKSAGVVFSLNPINGDESKVVIEGSWGLGEAVVSGSANPDKFIVDKITLQIEERAISHKTLAFAYNAQEKKMEYIEIPTEKAVIPCIEDREIMELARISKELEKYFNCPQDSEWCISKTLPFPESIFLVQTRPESVWSKRKIEPIRKESSYMGYLTNRLIEGW